MAKKMIVELPNHGALKTYSASSTTPYVTITPDVEYAFADPDDPDDAVADANEPVVLPSIRGLARYAKVRIICTGTTPASDDVTFKVFGRIRVDHQSQKINSQSIFQSQNGDRDVYQWCALPNPLTGALSHTLNLSTDAEWNNGSYSATKSILIDLEGVETIVAIPTSAPTLATASGTAAIEARFLDR